ncbi:TIGR01457 family HAD-type hydrolase [Paenibacillus lentus]|uniref:Acid sugar phosphatase n=1 Tax=Paenibacillus lentus TaxID=1338368 RepID=A0A3Q8S5C4_9BACL|nr:TIGR01457 family HAD-type hydrolase [Paenibacillus lentus]AZK47377.1 TIGR01457 family HAD-type hydrolase [Paenibacillus lentus]
MPKWKAYLIDLDGTMYHGNRMIPGADQLINAMKCSQIPYLFVTNNSSRTPSDVAEHLQQMGIPAQAEDVCTSAVAAAEYIASLQPGAKVAPIGEYGLTEALKQAGLTIDTDEPEYVVQGIDRGFTYDKLAQAARWIASGARYILTNPDLQLPGQEGIMPGAGTISAAIVAASSVEPVIIGKPSNILMKHAMERLGVRPDATAVIGDNMLTDISAGAHAGCGTILTLTGVTNRTNLPGLMEKTGVTPDTICEDLTEVQSLIVNSLESAT